MFKQNSNSCLVHLSPRIAAVVRNWRVAGLMGPLFFFPGAGAVGGRQRKRSARARDDAADGMERLGALSV